MHGGSCHTLNITQYKITVKETEEIMENMSKKYFGVKEFNNTYSDKIRHKSI